MAGEEVEMPKAYLYFAIAFSLLVEMLNIRQRKRLKAIQLHGISEDVKMQAYFKGNE